MTSKQNDISKAMPTDIAPGISEQLLPTVFFKQLSKLAIKISPTEGFYKQYSAESSSHGWCNAIHAAFMAPNAFTLSISEYKTKQEDKTKAQKMAFVRLVRDLGFNSVQMKDMYALVFRGVKDRRGGARKGAGRNAVLNVRSISLTLDEETIKRLDLIGKGNKSAAVRLLAEAYMVNETRHSQ